MKRAELVADIVGGTLVLSTLVVAFVLLVPVTVLKDWEISTPSRTYHLGDTIQLHTTSEKLRKASGPVERSIECDKGKDSTTSYPLNNSLATNTPGLNNTTYPLKIPTNITNLPVTCRVVIAVNYKVYGFRHIIEYAVSNNFRLE